MKEILSVFPEKENLISEEKNLLSKYKPGETAYFSTPEFALLAKPPFVSLLHTSKSDLNYRVHESLRFAKELGKKDAVVIGAIPFDVSQRPNLKLSASCDWDRSSFYQRNSGSLNIGETPNQHNNQLTIKPFPKPQSFLAGVNDALGRFSRKELDKVVLSRTLEIENTTSFNVRDLVTRLESKNRDGYTFAIDLKDDIINSNSGLQTLIGASPELLISKRGNVITANPLAGSEPRSNDPEEDQNRAKRLKQSEKDLREHALVIEAVEKALKPFCSKLDVPKEPELIHTATMWHLSTSIQGELLNPSTSSLELALAMHPTPAVCGFPKEKAKMAIEEIEGYDRGLFTGMVGWCNLEGDGDWAVTIRCALVEDNSIRLYAGAGIVEGSSPEKELAETEAKFNTMLNALGVKKDF